MADENENVHLLGEPTLEYLEYSDETPFVRAVVEEHIRRQEEEEEAKEAAQRKRVYELDESSVSFGCRIFVLIIISLLNALSFTQQYLLIVTIFGMANELKFGETECQVINETLARDYLQDHNMTGDEDDLCADIERCTENSTLFLPDVCELYYTGQGLLYEVLAGPSYIIIQGVISMPVVGLIQRFSFRPPFIIGLCSLLWTGCTFATAYVKDYWAIALLRFFFGVFSSPTHPVISAYLASVFPKKIHSLVFGIAHYAFMVGYGLAFVFIAVSDSIGWRWCYFITGAAGVFVAICACLMANPKVKQNHGESRTLRPSWKQQREGLKQITWPLLITLILANSSRLATENLGSYNITIYFAEYFPDFNVAIIGWVTIAASFPGSIFGAMVGDRLRRTSGILGRLRLSVVIMIISAVIVVMSFQTPVTIAVVLLAVYLAANEWFYVICIATISDLTPLESRTVVFALNIFLSYTLGGAVNLLVAPVTTLIGLRSALTILCGLFSVVTVVFLLLPLGFITCLKNSLKTFNQEPKTEADETTPLTVSYRSTHTPSTVSYHSQ